MSEFKIDIKDENLSEEVLSEQAIPFRVKEVNKLHKNMERSSFKSCHSTKTVREHTHENLLNSVERTMGEARKLEKSKTNNLGALIVPKKDDLRSVSSSESSPAKRGKSLKNEISSLLKISAGLRQKKSLFKAKKAKDIDIPEAEIKFSDGSSEGSVEKKFVKDEFFTFGVK